MISGAAAATTGSTTTRRALFRVAAAIALAAYYAAFQLPDGPEVDPDALVDLYRVLAIVDLGAFQRYGPNVGGLDFPLGPAYDYFLAAPLFVWRAPLAVLVWRLIFQVVTALVLHDTVRRLFDGATAAVALGLFLASSLVAENYTQLSHANYSFLLGALVVRYLHGFQFGGRSRDLVLCLAFLGLATHFHFTGAGLAAVVVAVALVGRQDARPAHLAAGCALALVPFLPTEPDLIAQLRGGNWGALNLLVPVACAAAVAGAAGFLFRRRARWLALVGVLLGWLGWYLAQPRVGGHLPALQLFGFRFRPEALAAPGAGGPLVEGVYLLGGAIGFAPIGSSPVVRALFLGLVGIGVAACLRRERRSGAVIVPLWAAILLPWSLYLGALGDFRYARYHSHSFTPLLVLAAVGAVAAWRWWLAARIARWVGAGPGANGGDGAARPAAWARGLDGRAGRWALRVAGGVALAAALVASWRQRTASTDAFLTAGRDLAAVRRGLGLGYDDLQLRVHGAVNEDWAFCDGRGTLAMFALQLSAGEAVARPAEPGREPSAGEPAGRPAEPGREPSAGEPVGRPGEPGQHFLLIDGEVRMVPELAGALVPLGPRLRALPFVPALRADRARVIGGPLPPGPVELPLRAALFHQAPQLRPRPHVVPGSLDLRGGAVLAIELPRDPPSSSSLRAIEVATGPIVPDSRCRVALTLDGAPVAEVASVGGRLRRTRFHLPPHPAPARVTIEIADCALAYLDAYDVDERIELR